MSATDAERALIHAYLKGALDTLHFDSVAGLRPRAIVFVTCRPDGEPLASPPHPFVLPLGGNPILVFVAKVRSAVIAGRALAVAYVFHVKGAVDRVRRVGDVIADPEAGVLVTLEFVGDATITNWHAELRPHDESLLRGLLRLGEFKQLPDSKAELAPREQTHRFERDR